MTQQTVRRRSLVGKGIHVTILTAVWVLLIGRITPLVILSGLLLATVITWAFPMPAIAWPGRIHPLGLLRLILAVTWDLAQTSIHLAACALNWRKRPTSGIVAVRLSSDADLYQVATSTILSIVPGSVVIEARAKSRTIYLHVFDMEAADAARERLAALNAEMRILRAFGRPEDIDRCRQAMTSAQADAAQLPTGENR